MSSSRAAIFDMDGLLIDSEPFWRAAEVEVFATVGVELTEEACVETTGLRIDEVVAHHHRRRPWDTPDRATVASQIVDRVIAQVTARGEALEGATDAIATCRDAGLRLALASSSERRLIDAVIERLGLGGVFEVIRSAQHERYGKPHPAVFLRTADDLAVEPTSCLVFEDSLRGVLAAKAANMVVIAVPDEPSRADPRFVIADRRLDSLRSFDASLIDELLA